MSPTLSDRVMQRHLEAHDEDAERVQDCEANLCGDVGLQQRLVQHICIRVAVS